MALPVRNHDHARFGETAPLVLEAAAMNLSRPALAPPRDVLPNFANPPNGNAAASVAFVAMMVVSTLCLFVRAYGKLYPRRMVYFEDVLVLCAYGNYWGCAWASYSLLRAPGFFVHNWDLLLGQTIQPYYYIFIFGLFYSVNLALIKIAILAEWCRVFVLPGTRATSGFWWAAAAVAALQAAFGVAAIFLLVFQCRPLAAIWDFTVPGRVCLPLNALQLASGLVHLVSDVAIFLLPQRVIWGLNLSRQRRLGLAVVFSLGALAVVCSVFRVYVTILFGQSPDTMYNIGPVILWATGEMSCGFFVACMPCLPRVIKESPVVRKIRSALGWGSTAPSSDGADAGEGPRDRPLVRNGGPGPATPRDADLEMDDAGLPLHDLKHTDSTERLRCGSDKSDDISPPARAVVARSRGK